MQITQTLEITKTIAAPINQVYRSFISPVALESWFSDFAELVPSENGRFYASWNAGHYAAGLIKEMVENQEISLTWRGQGEPRDTDVLITFKEEDDHVFVKVLHSNLGTTDDWIESSKAIRSGWEIALNNLKSVLETGLDKRIYDRPMLGIYPNQVIDEGIIRKFNLPVETGIQIGGVIEGLGAEAAGLQPDDVIFSLNGFELKGFNDFARAISGLKARDVVEVVFYRRDRKFTVDMVLSPRQTPEVPDSAADLAKIVAQSYEDFNVEMDKILEGVSDDEASFSPGEKEWSAKETLVHLMYTERWLHLAISCVVSDQRTGGFVNQLELIQAMANSYTLEDLVAELKKCEQITVNLLAALPIDFYTDKRRCFGFTSSFGQGFAKHSFSHLPQIEAAIAAARRS
jgi:uncharacterized protein YndB with AHSA1/START domain